MPPTWWLFHGWWHIYGGNSWWKKMTNLSLYQLDSLFGMYIILNLLALLVYWLFYVQVVLGKWGIKGSKLGSSYQDRLEELFHSESSWAKSTELECKFHTIPEGVGQRGVGWGGGVLHKLLSHMRALSSLLVGGTAKYFSIFGKKLISKNIKIGPTIFDKRLLREKPFWQGNW